MPGLRISYEGRSSHFWYPHDVAALNKAAFIKQCLTSHLANWANETVRINGEDVTRPVPIEIVRAEYGTAIARDGDGNAVVENAEPIDVRRTIA